MAVETPLFLGGSTREGAVPKELLAPSVRVPGELLMALVPAGRAVMEPISRLIRPN